MQCGHTIHITWFDLLKRVELLLISKSKGERGMSFACVKLKASNIQKQEFSTSFCSKQEVYMKDHPYMERKWGKEGLPCLTYADHTERGRFYLN